MSAPTALDKEVTHLSKELDSFLVKRGIFEFVSEQEAEHRLNTCLQCEHVKFNDTALSWLAKRALRGRVPYNKDLPDKIRCGKCGCALQAKVQFKRIGASKTKCPIGKWGNDDEA